MTYFIFLSVHTIYSLVTNLHFWFLHFTYACCLSQANDGSFMEEPGSGAVATIGEKQVSVGTLDWIRRYE